MDGRRALRPRSLERIDVDPFRVDLRRDQSQSVRQEMTANAWAARLLDGDGPATRLPHRSGDERERLGGAVVTTRSSGASRAAPGEAGPIRLSTPAHVWSAA
jgi:hypothetical protein